MTKRQNANSTPSLASLERFSDHCNLKLPHLGVLIARLFHSNPFNLVMPFDIKKFPVVKTNQSHGICSDLSREMAHPPLLLNV